MKSESMSALSANIAGADARHRAAQLKGTQWKVTELIAAVLGYPETAGRIEVKCHTSRYSSYKVDAEWWVLARADPKSEAFKYMHFRVYHRRALRFTQMGTGFKRDHHVDIVGEPKLDLTDRANALLEKARGMR